MPILFSAVAQEKTVIIKYSDYEANFMEVTEQILAKVPIHNNKLTYTNGNYAFHYISENKLVYFCITDIGFQQSRAFLFLNEIKKKYLSTFEEVATIRLPKFMYSDFIRTLAGEIERYNDMADTKITAEVRKNLKELEEIMTKNIDNVVMRGERLENLEWKTANLSTASQNIHSNGGLCWRLQNNKKVYVIITLIIGLAIYFISVLICGGFAWETCVR